MALDISQERHIKIEDKQGNEVLSKLYYHRECWREIMTGKSAMINIQKQASELFGGIKQQMGIKDTYEIT